MIRCLEMEDQTESISVLDLLVTCSSRPFKSHGISEFRSCVKVDRGERPGLPVPNSPYVLCGLELVRFQSS